MIQLKNKKYFSTLAIFAGSPSSDVHGAQIMKRIKQLSKEEVNFIGLGGEKMKKEGLTKNYGNINNFFDKPFYPYQNFHRYYIEKPAHPLMAPLHYKEYMMRQEMKKNEFFDHIFDIQPDSYLVLGNEFFMIKLYKSLSEIYQQRNKIKPPCMMLDKFIINQENAFKSYVDHYFYQLPLQPVNWQYFKFPSTFIGKQGVFNALEYVLKKSKNYSKLVENNKIWLTKEFHMEVVEDAIREERSRFREKYQILEDQIVIFMGCGNKKDEIQYSVDLGLKSVEELQKQKVLNNQLASNFKVVISVEQEWRWVVDDMVEKQEQIILVTEKEDKWAAMCGSDMGLAITGDILNEVAALHLPTIALNYQSSIQSYFTSLYGQYDSDVNIVAKGEIFPEKWTGRGGDAFPQNIAENWCQWIIDPPSRFHMIQRLHKVIPSLLPISDLSSSHQNTNSLIQRTNINYQPASNPHDILSQKIIESMDFYKLHCKSQQASQKESNRPQMLKQVLGHSFTLN